MARNWRIVTHGLYSLRQDTRLQGLPNVKRNYGRIV